MGNQPRRIKHLGAREFYISFKNQTRHLKKQKNHKIVLKKIYGTCKKQNPEKTLFELVLDGVTPTPQIFSAFVDSLVTNPNPKNISLRESKLNEKCIENLFETMKNQPTQVHQLDLSLNPISEETLSLIVNQLISSDQEYLQLYHLTLDGIDLDDVSIGIILELIQKYPKLKILELRNNHLSHSSIALIREASSNKHFLDKTRSRF
ncbi:nacht lrr and card domains-containing [Anaeramoeba ignava]|uniref:Nacht lrr and card domains-containing n=1 Tax=Anaeramoeba ignava TaxID=1746090 RepID=A0A9Q0L5Z7_ANAIG|nr:nacht lrr and card domains-containing [Anaeramoeba ignava]